MNIWLGFFLVLISLLANAFFSAAEMALVSANRLRLRHLAESGRRRAQQIQEMLDNPEDFLATTLVGINLFLVLGSTVASYLVAFLLKGDFRPVFYPVITTVIMLPLVLIFADIVPKSLVRPRATEISLGLYLPLRVAYLLLFPLVKTVALASRGVIRLLGNKAQPEKMFESPEDLNLLMEEGQRQGALTEAERKMISRVFDFGEIEVNDVMVPLIDVALAPEESRVGDIRKIIARTGHTRIPIYKERVDQIVGTVQATDLVSASVDEPITKLIRAPYIVPESKPLEELLEELRQTHLPLAIVVDEYGGVSGIITLENVIEEIVGDIRDEYDTEEEREFKIKGKVLELSGRLAVDDLNEEFDLGLPEEGEEETIAGFVIDLLGRIPQPGDRVSYSGYDFVVTQATDRRLVRLEVRGPEIEKKIELRG